MDLCLAPQVKNYSTIRRVRPRSPGRLYRHRTGIPWRDLPARFGDWNPPKANRKTQRLCDFALYCERNLVERFFNQLKHFRAVATRYDKLARTFLAGVQLAAAMILLN